MNHQSKKYEYRHRSSRRQLNAGELLRSCVDSLLNCPMEIEIIVMDNASTDGSLDALPGPCVQIIKNQVNDGFAKACNSGGRVASAQFLLFLSPDCSFKPGALAGLLDAIDVDDRVGMAGGLLANSDRTEQTGGRQAVPIPLAFFCVHNWAGKLFGSLATPVL